MVSTLLCPLFAWSAWTKPASVLAGHKGEGAALASVHLVGMGSASHRGWLRPRLPSEQRPDQRSQLPCPDPQWLAEPTPTKRTEAIAAS